MWIRQLKQISRTSSSDPAAIQKAQTIFDTMFETYVETEDSTFWPTTQIYNLLLETYAYSKDKNGANEAQTVLDRMEDPSNEFIARPNEETYLNVMDAYAMRYDIEGAIKVLEQQQKRYEETNDEAVKPSVDGQNKLIKAYGIMGDLEQAESIFRSLLVDDVDEDSSTYQS